MVKESTTSKGLASSKGGKSGGKKAGEKKGPKLGSKRNQEGLDEDVKNAKKSG